MDDHDSTLVALATYNERESLPPLVDEILRHAPDVHVLVVDDNSPDGTGQWCDERAKADARLHCLHRPGKLGLGTATLDAFRYSLAHNYTYVVMMDADFSHHPRYLPALRAAMNPGPGERVDVAIGSRYVPGGGTEGWPLRRRWMSRGVNLYARLLLGLTPRDCSGAFRCYRTETLRQVPLDRVRSRGYSFQEEILWHLKRAGARFEEIPIVFTDRRLGQSKINLGEAWAALRIILMLGVRNGLRPRTPSGNRAAP